MNGNARAPALLEDDDDLDDQDMVHKTDEFDRKYLDERSWETLAEDEHGRLIASGQAAVHRKRLRPAEGAVRIRRGLMRSASRKLVGPPLLLCRALLSLLSTDCNGAIMLCRR
jgi:hypothetical protein